MRFPGGWLSLENSNPMPISDFITFVSLFDGSSTNNGEIVMSDVYNNPTASAWMPSPIVIAAEPTVIAVDAPNDITQQIIADSMNLQTKMANLAPNIAPPLQNLVYLYGKVFIDSSHLSAGMREIPCCEGTPNEDLKDKSNYCPEDYGKGSRGLPPCGTMLAAKLGGPCLEVGKEDKSNNRLISGY